MNHKIRAFFTKLDYTTLVTFLCLSVLCILYTFPVSEGDFFWHVKTGRWIWEHRSLPSTDPFSFVNSYINQTPVVVERTRFYLTQYWAGQLALFGVWNTTGEAGMVVLRTVIYTGILLFVYWWLTRSDNGITPLVTVFAIGNVLLNYAGERPQIFAFLFMVLLLYLLEQLTRHDRAIGKHHAAFLVLLMLFWSNCHGSFILGVIIISLYLTCRIVTDRLQRRSFNTSIFALLSGAILISGLNPNGYKSFKMALFPPNTFVSNIAEYTSPLKELFVQHYIDYYYWGLLIAVAITIIFKFRSMSAHHIVVSVVLGALSLTGLRYIPFFILATPLIALHLTGWKPKGVYQLLTICVFLLWLGNVDFHNALKFRANKAFPVEAARFLNTVQPPGNIFNHSFWGGYLMSYTDYRVFADGRGIVPNISQLHEYVMAGTNWKSPLSFYNINTIIIPGTNLNSQEVFPLLLQLRDDDGWTLIYQDDVALVFLKTLPQNQKIIERYAIGKNRIETHLMKRLEWQTKNQN